MNENCTFKVSETNAKKEPTPPEVAPKNHNMVKDGQKEKGENYEPCMLVEGIQGGRLGILRRRMLEFKGKIWKVPILDPYLMRF